MHDNLNQANHSAPPHFIFNLQHRVKCVQYHSSWAYDQIHQSCLFLNQNPWNQVQIKASISYYMMQFESNSKIKHRSRNKVSKTGKNHCKHQSHEHDFNNSAWIKAQIYINPNDWSASNSMNMICILNSCWNT